MDSGVECLLYSAYFVVDRALQAVQFHQCACRTLRLIPANLKVVTMACYSNPNTVARSHWKLDPYHVFH